MSKGIVKLVLSVFDWDLNHAEKPPVSYKVRRVVGSTRFWPGQVLSRASVADLCEATGMFEITVVPNDD